MAIDERQVSGAFDNGYLNLILFATEACNFRCVYCYEDFTLGRMRPHVVQGVRNLLSLRAPELRQLDLGWFGGEPLLAKGVVLSIARHAQGLAATHGLLFRSNMATNGFYLERETAALLADAGVTSFQISLDGSEGWHDQTRRHVTGRGTFRKIWENVVGLSDSSLPLSLQLRVHVSPRNIEQIDDLITRINRQLAGDTRVTVSFHPIQLLGGPNDGELPVFDTRTAVHVRDELMSRLDDPRQRDTRSLDGAYVCYAARPNSLAIRSDGRVAKCTVALRDSRNTVGSIRADGSLELDHTRLRYWFRGWATLSEDQLACPMN